MFNSLHSSINRELFRKHLYKQSSHYESANGAINHCLLEKWSNHYAMSSVRFNPLYTAEAFLCYQSSLYEIYTRTIKDSATQRKPSCATTKWWILFTGSKDEWNTKEDTGTAVCQKAPFRLKQNWTMKKSSLYL